LLINITGIWPSEKSLGEGSKDIKDMIISLLKIYFDNAYSKDKVKIMDFLPDKVTYNPKTGLLFQTTPLGNVHVLDLRQ